MSNPYQVLGISRWDNKDRIKSAYREMVKQHHPDTGGDSAKIVSINAAYNTLKQKRGI